MKTAKNKPEKSALGLSSIGPELASLRVLAGDEMMAQALEIARERLKLTPEKLALMILRAVAPDEIIGEGEEAIVRGVSAPTLRGMKEREEIPRVVNG
jgi:hypothetical protein